MSKYAELLAQGWDPADVTRPVDPEVEKMRLAHEMELKRMEVEEREKERERTSSSHGRTYEGRKDVRLWKRGVADGSGAYSRVKGVPWFWKRR